MGELCRILDEHCQKLETLQRAICHYRFHDHSLCYFDIIQPHYRETSWSSIWLSIAITVPAMLKLLMCCWKLTKKEP